MSANPQERIPSHQRYKVPYVKSLVTFPEEILIGKFCVLYRGMK